MAKKKKAKKEKVIKKKPALNQETKQSILGIVCFTLALLTLLSFFNKAGTFGYYFSRASRFLLGQGFWLIPLSVFLIGLAVFRPQLLFKKKIKQLTYKGILVGFILFIFSSLALFHLIFSPQVCQVDACVQSGGGYLGFLITYPFLHLMGFWASLIIFMALIIIAILVLFDISLFRKKEELTKEEEAGLIKKSLDLVEPVESKKRAGLVSFFSQKVKGINLAENQSKLKAGSAEPVSKEPAALAQRDFVEQKHVLPASGFKLPPLDFLEKDKGEPNSGDIKANINIIKQTLQNFGIEVEMAEVNVGPTVTQYTLRPAQGVKLSKITALHNDLALALAAHPLRLEAPIPGRSLVGIEIPNRTMVMVRLRELLEEKTFKDSSSLLTFALGRNVAGQPVFADLSSMPHLLIAGATGTGKTVGLNNLIISLLYQNYPETLRLILVDPKRVEFTAYNDIPHLLTPVIVQPDKAVSVLRWATGEMERRFEILQSAGCRDLLSYNNSLKKHNGERMPYIAIIIDELADLMASQGREVEAAIVRLAQMARAVGLHLIVATQRPSVEVITGLIKANITSRIAFQVASQIDSRTILDMAGAEKLLGNGDMLYLSADSTKPRRIQGAYVSEEEISRVVNYLKKIRKPDYNEEMMTAQSSTVPGFLETREGAVDDELYEEAKQVVIQARRASASLLQRRLRIGYARAARLLDILEEKGVVGSADGAKPRQVYIEEGERIEKD